MMAAARWKRWSGRAFAMPVHRQRFRRCAADGSCGGLQQGRSSRGVVRRRKVVFVVDAGGVAVTKEASLHRSSTVPGVVKDAEIVAETTGSSNLERSKTEQNNPANDPAKQLLDDKISIRKKLKMLNRIATVKDDGTVVVDVPSTLDLGAPVDVGGEDGYGDVTVDESLDGADIPYRPPIQIVTLIVGTRGDGRGHPPPDISLDKLDPDRVGVAVHAVLEEDILRPILNLAAVRDGVHLIHPESMELIIRGSPPAIQMLLQASIHHDSIGRFSDVIGKPSIFQAHPCVLATESTEVVINLKAATALVCLVWRELNGQNPQFCQELKEDCFALVAGKYVEKLLEVARSFSEASWCACHVKEVLTIWDTLVDVLYNVQSLPFNSSDEVASISCKIVDALRGILHGTTDGNDNREESYVHPMNVVLIQVLEFFHDKRDMLQSLIPAGNPCSDMFSSWVSKLEKDNERVPQYEKGKRYIILLNNAYDVRQMMCCQGASFSDLELVRRLNSMIQQYMKCYFDECWVPLIMPLSKEDHLKRPRSALLDEFTRGFISTFCCQRTWKVLTVLKCELRAKIKNVVVTPYKAFLRALQPNHGLLSELVYSSKCIMRGKKKEIVYTVEQLECKIDQIFER